MKLYLVLYDKTTSKTFTKYLQEIFGKNFTQRKKEVQLQNLKKQ